MAASVAASDSTCSTPQGLGRCACDAIIALDDRIPAGKKGFDWIARRRREPAKPAQNHGRTRRRGCVGFPPSRNIAAAGGGLCQRGTTSMRAGYGLDALLFASGMNSTNARSFAACSASEMIVGGVAGRKVPAARAAMLWAYKLPGLRRSRKTSCHSRAAFRSSCADCALCERTIAVQVHEVPNYCRRSRFGWPLSASCNLSGSP